MPPIRFKCYYGSEIRMLRLDEEPAPEEFLRLLCESTCFGRPVALDKYEDHDGELITIMHPNDLLVAYDLYHEQRELFPHKVQCLKLFLKSATAVASSPSENPDSASPAMPPPSPASPSPISTEATHSNSTRHSGHTSNPNSVGGSALRRATLTLLSNEENAPTHSTVANPREDVDEGRRSSRGHSPHHHAHLLVDEDEITPPIRTPPRTEVSPENSLALSPTNSLVISAAAAASLASSGSFEQHRSTDRPSRATSFEQHRSADRPSSASASTTLGVRSHSSGVSVVTEPPAAAADPIPPPLRTPPPSPGRDGSPVGRLASPPPFALLPDGSHSSSSISPSPSRSRRRSARRSHSPASALNAPTRSSSSAALAVSDLSKPISATDVPSVYPRRRAQSSTPTFLGGSRATAGSPATVQQSSSSSTVVVHSSSFSSSAASSAGGATPPPIRTPPPSPPRSHNEQQRHHHQHQRQLSGDDAPSVDSPAPSLDRVRHSDSHTTDESSDGGGSEERGGAASGGVRRSGSGRRGTAGKSDRKGRSHRRRHTKSKRPSAAAAAAAAAAAGSAFSSSSSSLADTDEPVIVVNSWTRGQLLGRGAFGNVYMGMTDAGELIAVKQIPCLHSDVEDEEDEALRNLQKEIDVMKQLHHPNIVRYLGTEHDLESNMMHIFIEYVPGGSISSLLAKMGFFPEAVVRVYTEQILRGLAYLHRNHIIHRDVKGANILVGQNSRVKLADFGCSKQLGGLTVNQSAQNKTVTGTPYWMAPEVMLSKGHGRSADIWSLGCTVIEMATGRPPFSELEFTQVMWRLSQSPEPPDFPPHLSPECQDFLTQCFRRDPKDRPSASTLLSHPFILSESLDGSDEMQVEDIENIIPSLQNVQTSAFISTTFSNLPPALAIHVFSFLDVRSLTNAALVCKRWNKLLESSRLWLQLCQRHYARLRQAPDYTHNWKRVYLRHRAGEPGTRWLEEYTSVALRAHKTPIRCVAVHNSRVLAGCDDKRIRIWELKKGKTKDSLRGHTASVLCLHVFGDRAISGSADHSLRVWDLHSRKCIRTISSHTAAVNALAYDESDSVLYSADERGAVCLRSLSADHTRVLSPPDAERGPIRALHRDHAQQRLWSVSARGLVSLWDARSAQPEVRRFHSAGGELRSLTYSSYCDLLATGGEDSVVRLFDPGSGRAVGEMAHRLAGWQSAANSALHAERHHLVAFGGDGHMRVYDLHSGVCERSVLCVPDGVRGALCAEVSAHQLVTAGADASLRVWAFGEEASLRLSKLTSVQLSASSPHLASSLEDVAATTPVVVSPLSPAISSHRRRKK